MKKSIVLLFIVAITIVACNKRNNNASCQNLPLSNSQGFDVWQDTTPVNNLLFAGLNPNNNSELLFAVNWYNDGKRKVYKYSMDTKITTFLFEDMIAYSPAWGSNGWILYGLTNGTIWKIKDNGDSITQLQGIYSSYHPRWNVSATKFVVHQSSLINGRANLLYDYYSLNIVDTLLGVYGAPEMDFANDTVAYYILSTQIHSYNFNNKNDVLLAKYENNTTFSSACYAEEKIFFTGVGGRDYTWNGINAFNLRTQQASRIVPSCNSKAYSFAKYNRDMNKLLLNVSEYYNADVGKNTVWVRSYIVMMNLDGSNEERLPITIP